MGFDGEPEARFCEAFCSWEQERKRGNRDARWRSRIGSCESQQAFDTLASVLPERKGALDLFAGKLLEPLLWPEGPKPCTAPEAEFRGVGLACR